MITPVWLLLKREMRQSVRRWSDLISPLVFFVLVSSLFPLAISPAADVLRQVGPGVLWVAALLSMLPFEIEPPTPFSTSNFITSPQLAALSSSGNSHCHMTFRKEVVT